MPWITARVGIALSALLFCARFAAGATHDRQLASRIDAYLQPYVQTGNFSGVARVEKNGRMLFQKAYGFADHEHRVPNKLETRFHVASLSMQFTAAATLRLADRGSLSLDSHVGDYVHGVAGAEKITVRDLLTERSGLPDINELPDYAAILQQRQTPSTLVEKIAGRPLLFEPGSKFLHEEHSAYNLLALILEKKTGLAFPAAIRRTLFAPADLRSSGVDDDSVASIPDMALGYAPKGVSDLEPAAAIHWSAKSGNASAYTTAADEAKFVHRLFEGDLLSAPSLKAVLDPSPRVGYGWFRATNDRFQQMAYYSNGRAPGFASFVLYLPREHITVVVFSNIYSSATTTIGYDIASIVLGLPYTPFQPRLSAARPLNTSAATFQFASDFYQPNARIVLFVQGSDLALRWPSGDISSLIPLQPDHFVDRSYWEGITLARDAAGHPLALVYGHFRGTAVSNIP